MCVCLLVNPPALSCQVSGRSALLLDEILLLVFTGSTLTVRLAAEGELVAVFGLSCFHFLGSIRLFPAADESGHYRQCRHGDEDHNGDQPWNNTEHNTAAVHGVYALTTELPGHLVKAKTEDECLSNIRASSDTVSTAEQHSKLSEYCLITLQLSGISSQSKIAHRGLTSNTSFLLCDFHSPELDYILFLQSFIVGINKFKFIQYNQSFWFHLLFVKQRKSARQNSAWQSWMLH